MIKLNPHRQQPGFCGPSSLKMVLGYYGILKTENELAKLCGSDSKIGTRAPRLVAVAKELGMESFFSDESSLSELRRWVVEKGVPVIVNWFSEDKGHYSPVVAITEKAVIMMDPELGRTRRVKIETFMRVWFDFEPGTLPSRESLVVRRMIVVHR